MKYKNRENQKENYVFIGINPVAIDFNTFKEINKIHRHIKKLTKQQTKKQTKESIIDNLSKRLLELEFKHDNQTITKVLKWIFKNIYHITNCKKCIFIVKSVKYKQVKNFQKNSFNFKKQNQRKINISV